MVIWQQQNRYNGDLAGFGGHLLIIYTYIWARAHKIHKKLNIFMKWSAVRDTELKLGAFEAQWSLDAFQKGSQAPKLPWGVNKKFKNTAKAYKTYLKTSSYS